MDVIIPASSSPEFPLPGIGIKLALALCVAFYVVFFVAIVVLSIVLFSMMRPGEIVLDIFSMIVAPQILAWIVTIALGLSWSDMTFREARFQSSFPLQILPTLVLTSLGASIVIVEIVLLVPMPDAYRQSMVDATSNAPFLSVFVPLAIVAPLAEEFFFRGLLFRDFLERYSVTKSVWTTAVIFALFHLNPWQAIAALPLGLWFAWLVLRTGSIIPGILCHAIYNYSAAFLLQPMSLALGDTVAEWEIAQHLSPTVFVVGVVDTVVGAAILHWQLRGSNPVRIVPSNFPASTSASDLVDSTPPASSDGAVSSSGRTIAIG
jgi:membrane protease YdiL (CAAX protease family)